MSHSYVARPQAHLDLAENAYHLAEESLEVADRFLDAAERAFEKLAEFPELGARREYNNLRLKGLRMWPIPDFPRHLVFYLPAERGIEVVRVLHGARDLKSLLGES